MEVFGDSSVVYKNKVENVIVLVEKRRHDLAITDSSADFIDRTTVIIDFLGYLESTVVGGSNSEKEPFMDSD